MTLIGSFFFSILAGYGLSAFPMTFLNKFLNRPIIRDAEDFALTKLILRAENEVYVSHAKQIRKLENDASRAIGFIEKRRKKRALQ